jgi:hypothetical protein
VTVTANARVRTVITLVPDTVVVAPAASVTPKLAPNDSEPIPVAVNVAVNCCIPPGGSVTDAGATLSTTSANPPLADNSWLKSAGATTTLPRPVALADNTTFIVTVSPTDAVPRPETADTATCTNGAAITT